MKTPPNPSVRVTITFGAEIYDLLRERADLNRRSLNQEVLYLVEAALASEIEGNLQIIRMLMRAQGGLRPEHTAKGGHSGESSETQTSPL